MKLKELEIIESKEAPTKEEFKALCAEVRRSWKAMADVMKNFDECDICNKYELREHSVGCTCVASMCRECHDGHTHDEEEE